MKLYDYRYYIRKYGSSKELYEQLITVCKLIQATPRHADKLYLYELTYKKWSLLTAVVYGRILKPANWFLDIPELFRYYLLDTTCGICKATYDGSCHNCDLFIRTHPCYHRNRPYSKFVYYLNRRCYYAAYKSSKDLLNEIDYAIIFKIERRKECKEIQRRIAEKIK